MLQTLFNQPQIDDFGSETKVGAAVLVGGMPNLRAEKVSESRLNKYDSGFSVKA